MPTPIILAEKILFGEAIGFFIISVIYCIISCRKYKKKEISKTFLIFEFVYFSFINTVISGSSTLQLSNPGVFDDDGCIIVTLLLIIIVVVRIVHILCTQIDMIKDKYDNTLAVTLTIVSAGYALIEIGANIFFVYFKDMLF